MKGLFFKGTAKDAEAISKRLAIENPEMTISEYLKKHNKEVMVLN